MSKIIFYASFAVIMATFGLLVVFWLQIRRPIDSMGKEIIFKIEKGQSAKVIADNLMKNSLIKNPFIFRLYVFLAASQYALKSGEYKLSPAMSVRDIADTFIIGSINEILVTIPEGFTLKQIEDRFIAVGLVKKPGELSSYSFKDLPPILSDKPSQASLEGYLFPDTYRFFSAGDGSVFGGKDSLSDIVSKMISNLDKKLTPDLRMAIKNSSYNTYEILTMASLIEKEVKTDIDRAIVSGILWKRLKAKIPLQVDATLVYITGRQEIYEADKKINSPFNTYYYKGLPRGPINNPGLSAIRAAVYPQDSTYWYYLSAQDGATIFSKTLEEHNHNKAVYLK